MSNFGGFVTFMTRNNLMLAMFCLFAATGCATNGASSSEDATDMSEAAESAVRQTGDGLTDAALSPLEDLNLRREDIPERLASLDTPYGLPQGGELNCVAIADEVSRLTAVLGEDDDLPPPDEERDDEDRAKWAADKSSDAALGAVASEARDFIPFRGLVRDATGASAHSRRVTRAYRLGGERRAYLKGYGQAIGCHWPAAPLQDIEGLGQRIEFRGDRPD